jgi:hypothetical protein
MLTYVEDFRGAITQHIIAPDGTLLSAVKSMPDARLDRRGNRSPASGWIRITEERNTYKSHLDGMRLPAVKSAPGTRLD